MIKSVRAVFAGLFVVVFLSEATDYGLVWLHVLPRNFNAFTETMLIVATLYRAIYAAFGGYVAAWYAPGRPVMHAAILAAIGFALGILGAVAGWRLGHHWYPIAIAVTGPVCTVLGGWLYWPRA
jgi:hypothetical protein